MTLNMVKLCVGAASIEDLEAWQTGKLKEQRAQGKKGRVQHSTFQTPKRQEELLDGGSLYWVIKGFIQARQRLIGFEDGLKADGSPCCHILLARELVPVRPVPRRAFQGWRYFSIEDSPPDLASGESNGLSKLPEKMRKELAELFLI